MKKEKAISAEMQEKIKLREEKELARLLRQQAKPKIRGYLAFMLLIVTIVYIADEITTQIGTQMQDVMSLQVFAPLFGQDKAVSAMTLLGYISMAFAALSFVYKPLSDRYGRKIFLVINTLAMGVGMIIISLTTSIPVYILGSAITMFFIPQDMQATYIYECAPEKHRGKFYSIAKFFATLGMLLIPILRDAFITETDASGFKYVYMIPGLIAIVVAIIAIFLIRESDAFLVSRIRQLTMTNEEKELAKNNKKVDVESAGGIVSGFKFIISHKQILWLVLAGGFMMYAMFITSHYTTILSTGYAKNMVNEQLGIDLNKAREMVSVTITKALYMFPIGSGVIQLVQGFFSDKLGRKPTSIIMSAVCLATFGLFYFGSIYEWNIYLVGLFTGISVGAYWAANDIIQLMISESVSTNLRNSVRSITPMISGIIYGIGLAAFSILMGIMGDMMIGPLCFYFAVPGLAIGLIILSLKAKETNGVNLTTLKGDEFE